MTKPIPSDLGTDAGAPGEEILYGAQTHLAVENFQISGSRFPRAFIRAPGLIKACAACANGDLGQLATDVARAMEEAAMAVAEGRYEGQFPADLFQTGSGTGTDMNANEVIAELAGRSLGRPCMSTMM